MPCRYGEALAWLTHALEIARRAEDRQTVDEVTEMMAGALFFGPTPADDALDRITEMLNAQLTPLSRGVVTAMHGGIQAMVVSSTRRWKTTRLPIGSSGTSGSRRFCERSSTSCEPRPPTFTATQWVRRPRAASNTRSSMRRATRATCRPPQPASRRPLRNSGGSRRPNASRESVGRQQRGRRSVAIHGGGGVGHGALGEGRPRWSDRRGPAIDLGRCSQRHVPRPRQAPPQLGPDLGEGEQIDEAVEAAREALSFFVRKGVVPAVARAKALLAELGAAPDLP